MNRLQKIAAAKRHGIKIPVRAYRAAQKAGIPFSVMCAFLEQETAGGINEFGHDPTIFAGAGRVTKSKYLRYKAERKRTGKMQGVGPMQLTYFSFQDDADRMGGCWRPYINCLRGAQLLHSYWNRYGNWERVATAYNGSPAYGKQVNARIQHWKQLLS